MPYVNIKVTGGSEAPTAEQKAELIAGVTELLARGYWVKILKRRWSLSTKWIWKTGG